MKTLIVFSSLFFFCATASYGQSGLEIGLRYNPEFTGIANSSDAAASPEIQFASHFIYDLSFGAGALYHIDEHYGIGIDILFSREGQAFSGTLINSKTQHPDAYSAVVERQIALNGVTINGD